MVKLFPSWFNPVFNPVFNPGKLVLTPGKLVFTPGKLVFTPGKLVFTPGKLVLTPGRALVWVKAGLVTKLPKLDLTLKSLISAFAGWGEKILVLGTLLGSFS